MKYLYAFICCIATMTANAQTWNCGDHGNNVTATFADGTMTVSGSGAMEEYTVSNDAP